MLLTFQVSTLYKMVYYNFAKGNMKLYEVKQMPIYVEGRWGNLPEKFESDYMTGSGRRENLIQTWYPDRPYPTPKLSL